MNWTQKRVTELIAYNAERDRRQPSKYWLNANACQCLVCGELLMLLTHCHAEKHGFKNKYEMIEAGKVKYFERHRGYDHKKEATDNGTSL